MLGSGGWLISHDKILSMMGETTYPAIHSIENVEDDGDDHEEYDVKYDGNDNASNEYWTCTVLLFTVLSLHSVVCRAIKCIII